MAVQTLAVPKITRKFNAMSLVLSSVHRHMASIYSIKLYLMHWVAESTKSLVKLETSLTFNI